MTFQYTGPLCSISPKAVLHVSYINIIGVPHEILFERNILNSKKYVLNARKVNLET